MKKKDILNMKGYYYLKTSTDLESNEYNRIVWIDQVNKVKDRYIVILIINNQLERMAMKRESFKHFKKVKDNDKISYADMEGVKILCGQN